MQLHSRHFTLLTNIKTYAFYTWVAQCQASDFGSGHDLVVHEFEPRVRLCADCSEPGACFAFCVSVSLCPSPTHALSFSVSLKNKHLKRPTPFIYSQFSINSRLLSYFSFQLTSTKISNMLKQTVVQRYTKQK